MAEGFNPLGASAYSNTSRIAMVRPAIPVKDWRYYEKTILATEEAAGRLYAEYKDGGTWKEQYKTWEAACEPLGKSRRHVDRLILHDTTIRTECPDQPNKQDKKESSALKKVEAAREEEPEKPHIKTADEVKADNAEADKATPKTDASGCPIPQHLIENREDYLEEVSNAIGVASQLKCLFECLPMPQFTHLKASGNVQTFINGASAMYSAMRECLPEVVCPQCQAKAKACHVCHGSGWISQVRWNRDWVKSHDAQRLAEVKRRAA